MFSKLFQSCQGFLHAVGMRQGLQIFIDIHVRRDIVVPLELRVVSQGQQKTNTNYSSLN